MFNRNYKENLVNVFKKIEGSDLPYLIAQQFRNVQYWKDNIPSFEPFITYGQLKNNRIGQWSGQYIFTDEDLRELSVQQAFLKIIRRISYTIQLANMALLSLPQPIICIKKPLPENPLINMGQVGFHQVISSQGIFSIYFERNNIRDKPDFFAPHRDDYIFFTVIVEYVIS